MSALMASVGISSGPAAFPLAHDGLLDLCLSSALLLPKLDCFPQQRLSDSFVSRVLVRLNTSSMLKTNKIREHKQLD